jgi:putative ABC transport system permease protein
MQTSVKEVDRNQPFTNIRPLSSVLDEGILKPRAYAVAESTLATIAVAVASLGLYGLVATIVGQSAREISIRIALGASRVAILRLVVGRAALTAIAGVAAGVVITLWILRSARAFVSALTQPPYEVVGASALLLLAVAATSSVLTARSAWNIDPARLVRSEN